MAELEGKAALVTGAGVGIGRAIAIKLASEGARVLVVDLNEATAQETVDTIQKRVARQWSSRRMSATKRVWQPWFKRLWKRLDRSMWPVTVRLLAGAPADSHL